MTATVGVSAKSDSYFMRHWRGELSLPRSYWINGVLIFGIGCNFLWLAATLATNVAYHEHPIVAAPILLLLTALQLGAYAWALVGVWRSAARYKGPRIWSFLARAVTCLGVLISIANLMQIAELIESLLRSS